MCNVWSVVVLNQRRPTHGMSEKHGFIILLPLLVYFFWKSILSMARTRTATEGITVADRLVHTCTVTTNGKVPEFPEAPVSVSLKRTNVWKVNENCNFYSKL